MPHADFNNDEFVTFDCFDLTGLCCLGDLDRFVTNLEGEVGEELFSCGSFNLKNVKLIVVLTNDPLELKFRPLWR